MIYLLYKFFGIRFVAIAWGYDYQIRRIRNSSSGPWVKCYDTIIFLEDTARKYFWLYGQPLESEKEFLK